MNSSAKRKISGRLAHSEPRQAGDVEHGDHRQRLQPVAETGRRRLRNVVAHALNARKMPPF
jgi:hypothetical protein